MVDLNNTNPSKAGGQAAAAISDSTAGQATSCSNYFVDIYLDYHFMLLRDDSDTVTVKDPEAGYVEVCEFEDGEGLNARVCNVGDGVQGVRWHSNTPFLLFPKCPNQWQRAPIDVPVYYTKQDDQEIWAAIKSRCMGKDQRGLEDWVVELGIARAVRKESSESKKELGLEYDIFFKPKPPKLHTEDSNTIARGTVVLES